MSPLEIRVIVTRFISGSAVPSGTVEMDVGVHEKIKEITDEAQLREASFPSMSAWMRRFAKDALP
jgi:hypothetical protein